MQRGAEIVEHGFGVTKSNSTMSLELGARNEIYDSELVLVVYVKTSEVQGLPLKGLILTYYISVNKFLKKVAFGL